MEGAGGQTGGVIGAGDHCRLASAQRLGHISEARRKEEEEGEGKERGGKLEWTRAEDKRRDGVVGFVAER